MLSPHGRRFRRLNAEKPPTAKEDEQIRQIDELEVTLEPIQKRPGWFTGSFLPPRPGPLEVSIKLPDDDPGKAPES